MVEKQNSSSFKNELLTWVILFLTVLICFIFLVPKVTSSLFPWKRQMILQTFLTNVQKAHAISPQEFWEFREFYSPGFYTFDKNGLSENEIQKTEKRIGIAFVRNTSDLIFLSFSSPHLTSMEMLASQNSLGSVVPLGQFQPMTPSFSQTNEIITKGQKGNIYIIFLKSIADMKTANGFFDYTDVDKSLVEGKYWVDITKVDTN